MVDFDPLDKGEKGSELLVVRWFEELTQAYDY